MVIVTGMSGAGKTQAVNALEDIGYYCVDNVPPMLVAKFATLPSDSANYITKIALVVDVRSKELFSQYTQCLDELCREGYPYKVLFLDCGDQVLFNRYKETRRRHPLIGTAASALEYAIAREREMLKTAKEIADFVIDTSKFSATRLREKVRELFLTDSGGSMVVTCNSFGFKHGIPSDSDLMFDVRCLPNPFYHDGLRELRGTDEAVKSFVLSCMETKGLVPKLTGLIDYLIPLYIKEGRSQLVVSIGCTGGHHRSVVLCEQLCAHLVKHGVSASASHRDISR